LVAGLEDAVAGLAREDAGEEGPDSREVEIAARLIEELPFQFIDARLILFEALGQVSDVIAQPFHVGDCRRDSLVITPVRLHPNPGKSDVEQPVIDLPVDQDVEEDNEPKGEQRRKADEVGESIGTKHEHEGVAHDHDVAREVVDADKRTAMYIQEVIAGPAKMLSPEPRKDCPGMAINQSHQEFPLAMPILVCSA
jgi:hypothetical protein